MSTTFTTPTLTGHPSGMTPDPEVPERAARRRFTAEYKLKILAELDSAPRGEAGAILRREGLYSSLVTTWREQRRSGSLKALSPHRRGPKPDPLAKENAKLRKENEKLRRDLENARLVIDVQKKVSRLLVPTESDEAN